MKTLPAVLTAIIFLYLANPVHAGCDDGLNEISTDLGCTKIRTYKSADLTDTPILVVALHGDAPFNNPGYQYRFAESVASRTSNVISVGMLRPGYTDPLGRSSGGIKGDAIGDNYDETRVRQMARAIQALKKMYAPSKVILAGHSGGAAITANMAGLYPLLIDHAFLVSCPCDVNAWRENMVALTGKSIFDGHIDALSPIDLVGRVNRKTAMSLLVGKNDRVAPPVLSETYKTAAEKSGVNVTLAIVEGRHDIFLSPDILNAVMDIISSYNRANAAGAKNRGPE